MYDLREFLASRGYATVEPLFYETIDLWNSWYKGSNESFHTYRQYNGVSKVARQRLSLGMAKKICEDKADLLLNEKAALTISHEPTQRYITKLLEDNNFWVMANQLIEIANALGTGAFVEFIKDGKIQIDAVEAGSIYPLSWENGEITECAFASEFTRDGESYLYVNMHVLENGAYVIRNHVLMKNRAGSQKRRAKAAAAQASAYDSLGARYTELAAEDLPAFGLEAEIQTGGGKPFFQIIKPNMVNNVNRQIPMGASVFANSIDVLKGIDIIYDSYINEFTLGKKRIFVDASLMQVAIGGGSAKPVPVFDTNDVAFYGLSGLKDKNEMLREINMELRVTEHMDALNNNLNILSAKCGFGQHYYTYHSTGLKTATEVISQNNDLYKRVRKDEILLGKALTNLAEALICLANRFLHAGLAPDPEITVHFDDSIMEDKSQLMAHALTERNAGLIDDVEYFKQTRNMTEGQAAAFAASMKNRPGLGDSV